MRDLFVVRCPSCGEEHYVNDCDFLNVEENVHGQDVMFFVCPDTNSKASSLVYRM